MTISSIHVFCTCSKYFKSNICKQIIGAAAIEKVNIIPNEAKLVDFPAKPKRGRPKEVKRALQRDDDAEELDAPAAFVPAVTATALYVLAQRK